VFDVSEYVSGHATVWMDAATAADDEDELIGDNDVETFARRRIGNTSFINSFATSDRSSLRRRDGRILINSKNI